VPEDSKPSPPGRFRATLKFGPFAALTYERELLRDAQRLREEFTKEKRDQLFDVPMPMPMPMASGDDPRTTSTGADNATS
jgi:hypothetical protein